MAMPVSGESLGGKAPRRAAAGLEWDGQAVAPEDGERSPRHGRHDYGRLLPVWGAVRYCASFIVPGPGPRRAPGDLVGGQVRMGPHPGKQPQKLDPVAGIKRNEVIGEYLVRAQW